MSLQEYYATNYSRCNIEYSFLASWEGLAYPNHLLQCIALPFQIFTFYLILKKTPKTMQSMKWPLFVNHLACFAFDLAVCTLSTPYVFSPILGSFGVGILSSFGIPFSIQLAVGMLLALCVIGSYIFLFESRSSFLQDNRFRMTRKTTRFLYHLAIFLHNLGCISIFLKAPADQESARFEALKIFPCPTREYFLFDVTMMISDQSDLKLFMFVFLPSLLVMFGGNVMFHGLCVIYYLYVAPSNVISKETRQLQKSFLIGISCQTIIPLFFLGGPFSVMVVTNVMGNYSQQITNLTMICVGSHGLSESIAIATVHKPYRDAVKKLFQSGIFKRTRTLAVVDLSNMLSNSLENKPLSEDFFL